jgi:predicted RND superfamily exporter protein
MLSAVFILSVIAFRSLLAGMVLILFALMANLLSYTYMNHEVVGLTVDTISAISLGVGLGISHAIYSLVAIRDEIVGGLPLNQAIRAALRGAGTTILSTCAVMMAGLAPWVFSPVLFQNEMSALLILLMTTNLIAGLLILPALLILIRPRFLVQHEPVTTAGIALRAGVQSAS